MKIQVRWIIGDKKNMSQWKIFKSGPFKNKMLIFRWFLQDLSDKSTRS